MADNQLHPVMDAIHTIQRHLRVHWIVDSCKDERVLGCASCAMTRLHEDLDMLMHEIENGVLDGCLPPEPKEAENG